MTYLEEYLKENNCMEDDFWVHQLCVDGFCPRDVDGDECLHMDISCEKCWKREIVI